MVEQPQKPPLPEPNPITMHAHRRQAFWQIKLPLIVGVVLVLASSVMVLVVGIGMGGDVSRLADISIMWLITPMLILGTILILLQIAMIYMMTRVLPVLPSYTRQVQDIFVLIRTRIGRVSDVVAEPFVRGHSLSASMRAFKNSLRWSIRQPLRRD